MKHRWIHHPDSESCRFPFQRFRACANCGAQQKHESNHEWMRVVSYSWWPLVGRCKPERPRCAHGVALPCMWCEADARRHPRKLTKKELAL